MGEEGVREEVKVMGGEKEGGGGRGGQGRDEKAEGGMVRGGGAVRDWEGIV